MRVRGRRPLVALSAAQEERNKWQGGEASVLVDHAEYLPGIYQEFRERYPGVASAQDTLAQEMASATPFDDRTVRLLKLALAVGAQSEGAVRSNTRKALALGASADELRAVAMLAVTTCGFPTAIAGLGWIDDVDSAPTSGG